MGDLQHSAGHRHYMACSKQSRDGRLTLGETLMIGSSTFLDSWFISLGATDKGGVYC